MTVAIARSRRSGIRLAAALGRLEADSERDRFLARRRALLTGRVAERLIDASRDQLRVDFQRALTLAEAAEQIARRLQDRQLHGLTLRAIGNALSVAGDSQGAVTFHERAIAAFADTANDRELARTLNAIVQPLILLGRYDRALDAAGQARALFEEQGDQLRLARLDINVGNLLHRQDRFAEALERYERAYAQLLPLGDSDGVLSTLHNQAVTLISLNDFHRALAAYRAARQIAEERGLSQALGQADYNIAWLHYLRGEYSRAIDMLHAAAAGSKQTGDRYHAALSLLDLSEIYLELNLSADARDMAEQARVQFTALGMGYEAAKALTNIAIAHGQEGKAFKAIELFSAARAQLVAEKNLVWPSLIDLYQAVLLVNEGRLFEARRLCTTALACFDQSTLRSKSALARLVLARIALRLGAPADAQRNCHEALATIAETDTPILGYHGHLLLGHARAQAGDREGAFSSYEAAREALERLRSRLRGEELKIAFAGNKVDVYERLIELSLDGAQNGSAARAFEYIEQAKARTLFELMFQPVHALARKDTSESPLAQSVRDLREELNWYYHLVEQEQLRPGEASADRLDGLRREIGAREKDMARAIRQLAGSDRQQADLHQPGACSIDHVRAALPDDALLVEYFQVGDRLLVATLDREDLQITPVAVMPSVANDVRLLQFQLSKFQLGAEYVRNFGPSLFAAMQANLQKLFTELLEPVWARARGRHLLVVPHGVLHYVPFHALFDGSQYVTDACTVSYAPSASVYTRCEERGASDAKGALVIGVPDAQAPFIDAEVRTIASMLPGSRLLVGADATEAAFRAGAPHCRILHIASHGYFRADNPMFSGIRLGDTYLNVYDLYRLRLGAELVTLSGCATGANVAAAGDELLGITRGLFCAGARTLLLSLWNVHDESTSRFMGGLYQRIAGGETPVSALRSTMADIRADYPHPYYWAPFVLTGKFRA